MNQKTLQAFAQEAAKHIKAFVHDKNSINVASIVFLSFRPTGEILTTVA
jgi:hypothetical protein